MHNTASFIPYHIKYIVIYCSFYEACTADSGVPWNTGDCALIVNNLCNAVLGLPAGFSVKEITNIMTNSLHSCGNIILLISGGGMLRFILQNSGIGELLGIL